MQCSSNTKWRNKINCAICILFNTSQKYNRINYCYNDHIAESQLYHAIWNSHTQKLHAVIPFIWNLVNWLEDKGGKIDGKLAKKKFYVV